MGPRRTLLFCVVITLLLHVVTYLLNTQLPLQILALGGRHAQIGWLFAATTGVAMILRPQVGGWTDRFGGRAVMLPGAITLVATMLAFFPVTTPAGLIALMVGMGIANALLSTTGSIVVANASAPDRRGEALSMYYVASSAGVATGPAAGFALAAVGGITLNLAVGTALSVVVLCSCSRCGPRPARGRWPAPASVGCGVATLSRPRWR
jgi:MFS family permease